MRTLTIMLVCAIIGGCVHNPPAGPIHFSHVKALTEPCPGVHPEDGLNLKAEYPKLLSLYGDCADKVNGHIGRAKILSRG